jgi:hypothetical protein
MCRAYPPAAAATAGRARRLLYAYSGSADVDAVVTAFVLAAARASVSAGSIGRTESSAMGSVRACGEERGFTWLVRLTLLLV